MNAAKSVKLSRKIALYCAVAAVVLLLVHAITHQASFGGPVCKTHAVDIDSMQIFSPGDLTRFIQRLRRSTAENVQNSNMGKWAVRKGLNKIAMLSGESDEDKEKIVMKMRRQVGLQGELYSYYLNCYLDMWNAPPTALGCINDKDGNWVNISAEENDTTTLPRTCYIINPFVEDLNVNVYMPDHHGKVGLEEVATTPNEINHVLQWSDLVLFDFLSGHMDRLQDNLIIPHIDILIPIKTITNLAKTSSGDLLLIDHEATFHTSYDKARSNPVDKSRQYHFLKTVSVFRKHTVERMCILCSYNDPVENLEAYINDYDPISLVISSKLKPSDRIEFKQRLIKVCSITCHLLTH